jgi:ketosteroid isomerase-like protein
VGRAAIRSYFARQPGSTYVQAAHLLTTERLDIDGNVAIDMGTWTSTGGREGQQPNTATDRYLVVWVRESDGKWRMLYDMWHTPRPPG